PTRATPSYPQATGRHQTHTMINDLRTAVVRNLGNQYAIGIYGCRNVCRRVSAQGLATRSFVSSMSTGYSGNLGFPLPTNWAFDQIKNYWLASGTAGQVEIDNDICSGRDLGVDSVSRARDPNDAFYTYVIWLEARALQWWEKGNTSRSQVELVAQYLRYRNRQYNGAGMADVCGAIDLDFIDFADSYLNRPDVTPLRDPSCFYDTEVEHFGAVLGAMINHTIHSSHSEVSLADFGGWAGDLLSALGNWAESGLSAAEAYDFGLTHIASIADVGYFNIGDYLADVDAMVMGLQIKSDSTLKLSYLFQQYYASVGMAEYRFFRFFQDRFDSDKDTLLNAAKAVFFQDGDLAFTEYRNFFWSHSLKDFDLPYGNYPLIALVPDEAKNGIVKAFAKIVRNYAS
ncbi:MAG: DUF1906 domain-containing protein, partial [Micromonosporaceae bacterium]|nr:DUF1906 domain-containing protein [Micromonosporaceae bacterium]